MDLNRRNKALATWQRIKEHELDEQAAKMGTIRAQQGQITRELDDLTKRVETESHITSAEAAPFLASFLQAVEKRRSLLNEDMKVLDEKAAQIEERLFETYSDVRANEMVLDKLLLEKRRTEDHAEAHALEEVARNRYMRQMATKA